MIGIGRYQVASRRRTARWALQVMLAAPAVVVLAACGGLSGTAAGSVAGSAAQHPAAFPAKADAVTVIGKIDADMGPMGTFTGKDGWPAVAPANIHVRPGAKVVLTIREYDDMVTPLADHSPFLDVMGGTETVNGKKLISVSNQDIAHTFTIPALGINVPLPMASMDGPAVVRFTFRAPATPGSYQWLCVTPCGTGPDGISGAMHTDGWMRGHLIVG